MSRDGSLSSNIIANYVSQIYVTVIGIAMVPMYIGYMGAEAYGLVGFFVMLQAWFSLLDMGLTPTAARESARYRGGALAAVEFRRLMRALQALFALIALAGGAALLAAAGPIARDWLRPGALPVEEVEFALRVMSVVVALRWMSGLYRGAISGAERLIWLANFSSLIATFRFVGVVPCLVFVDSSPSTFFTYQLGVAAVELVALMLKSFALLPAAPAGTRLGWSLAPVLPVLRFALTIALATVVGLLITQSDKLILSNVLPLAEYGYFSLAVLVASGVLVISGPVSGAIMPRMARLEAEGDHDGLIAVYRSSTQLVAVIASASAITLAFCAEPLLSVWTGNQQIAAYAAPLLVLYALGNGVFAVVAFPYYLQYAKGKLRLHLMGNIGFAVLIVPGMIWAARHNGGIGAASVWLGLNLITFVAWLPLVHAKFEPGLNRKWYLQDVLTICAATAATGALLDTVLPSFDNRIWQLGAIAAFGTILLCVGALASSYGRYRIAALLSLRSLLNGALR